MKSRNLLGYGIALALILAAGGSSAAPLFSKPVDATQSLLYNDENGQHVADNFILPAGGTVTVVQWYGGYAFNGNEADPHPFVIRFFNDASGVPQLTPFVQQTVTVSGTDTGLNSTSSGLNDIFVYTAAIAPVTFAAGSKYWISIREADDATAQWFWQASTTVPGEVWAVFFQGNWLADGAVPSGLPANDNRNELAFTLNPEANAAPEPATLSLLLAALMLWGFTRRRSTSWLHRAR